MLKFLSQFPELIAVMSEKADGSMKLTPSREEEEKNREQFFEKIGADKNKIISAGLANGTNLQIVSGESPKIIDNTDALITKGKGVFLAITVADCIPVLFYEPQEKIVAIAHAGWRGIVGNIITNTVQNIIKLGGKAHNLKVALGPGINECHFEIKEDVLRNFESYQEYVIKRDGATFVDLKGIIKKQLANLGARSENVEDNQDCTFCHAEKYFSFRRDKPKEIEAMIVLIGME